MDDAKIVETSTVDTNSHDTGDDTGTDSGRDTGTETDTGSDSGSDTGEPQSPCVGVKCAEPQANECNGIDALDIFAVVGYCINGSCVYGERTEACESGACSGGVCVENPCQGVTCKTPPQPVCEGNALRVYAERGFCAENGQTAVCEYASMLFECPGSCANGVCVDEPCVGVVCDSPPARYCEDGHLYVFDTRGRCVEGQCRYASQDVECAAECGEGRCQGDDACRFVTCADSPANYCVNDTTLRVFETTGGCEAGVCYYRHNDMTCADGCAGGQCVGEPCAGVTCDQPPPPRCANNTSLQVWDGLTGVCEGGMCTYGTANAPCPAQCVEGVCEGSICTGVICNSPFAEYCSAGSLVSFDVPGACGVDGACTYDAVTLECSDTCAQGFCHVVSDTTVLKSSFFNVTSGSGRVSCENYQGWITAGGTLGSGTASSENYTVKLGVGGAQ